MTKSVTRTALIRFVILVALVAGLWFGVLSPRLDEPARLQQQALDLDGQVSNLQNQYAQLRDDAAFQSTLEQVNDELVEKFPSRPDVPGLVDQVTDTATRAGLAAGQIVSIEPGEPVVAGAGGGASTEDGAETAEGGDGESTQAPTSQGRGSYATMEVAITLNGSLQQVGRFVDELRNQPRYLFVDEITVEPGDDGQVRAVVTTTSVLLSLVDAPTGPEPEAEEPSQTP